MPTPPLQTNPERYFTRTVTVPRHDSEGNVVNGPDGKPIVDHTLGNFTFRRPTVLNLRDIGLRRAQSLSGIASPDVQTSFLVEIYAAFPYQVEAAPPGWDWENQYDVWDVLAVYQAYAEGLQQYAGVKVNGAVQSTGDESPTGIGDEQKA